MADPTVVYLANPTRPGVAHLRADCRILASRPSWCPAPSPVPVTHIFSQMVCDDSHQMPLWMDVRVVKAGAVSVVTVPVCVECNDEACRG